MQSPSNASGSPSIDRQAVTDDLYLKRGARDASNRCDVNSKLGDFDLLETVVKALRLIPGETVFDVGCGSGQHLARFTQCVAPSGCARGFDISPEAVASTRARGLDATVADAASLPAADTSVDALTSNFAIYYHPRLQDVITEWGRVLKLGGRLVISGPSVDTNRELYQFHREVTGSDPSDADLMALGYVEGIAREAIAAAGNFDHVSVEIFTNRIQFLDAASFLSYWKSTSLFARTAGASYEAGEAKLAASTGPFLITKRVAVLSACRR